jgi:hypothetical protein
MLNKLWCNIKEWGNELVGILIAITLFLLSPQLLRWFDPTAGAFDAGVLQVIVFAIVATLTFSFLSWIGLKINWQEVFDFAQKDLGQNFKLLTPWQKVVTLLVIYFGYLIVFVIMAHSL